MTKTNKSYSNQVIHNIALYYTAYILSRYGWNVRITSRNTRGVDIVIYSQDKTKMHTIQVKGLFKRNPVPFGSNLNNLIAEFYVIVLLNELKSEPCAFVLKKENIKLVERDKNGKVSYWLTDMKFLSEFKDKWDIIGYGNK
ncbi:hypothetical protein DDW13_00120 [Acidianus hospitalis]|uniref:Endonuclease n=1 Tax=Acidianus hospitalis TaxID=563177 RepID=A0A2T9XCQ5_9CREN|nr:hypothetical protein DDW13_00120 [Acidianus hospitalis]